MSAGAHDLVGASAATRRILDFIGKVASKDATVLLRGESGVGKEVVARAIHQKSSRSEGPFVALNCAAVPDDLLESEFFGFEKGAFTGAVAAKKGKIEAAHGGTLFLDEVGDMKPSMQVKLLRVLQERELDRVGSLSPVPVDVRVIAATNRDLESAIGTGGFREDLYYRLKVVSLTIPPLRERRDDILPLAQCFLSKCAIKHQRHVHGITPPAQAILQRYDWPGNVRQLENAIESAVVLGAGDFIEPRDLPVEVVVDPPKSFVKSIKGLRKIKREAERFAIENALILTDGNYRDAARILDVHERTVWRRMEELNLTCDPMQDTDSDFDELR